MVERIWHDEGQFCLISIDKSELLNNVRLPTLVKFLELVSKVGQVKIKKYILQITGGHKLRLIYVKNHKLNINQY